MERHKLCFLVVNIYFITLGNCYFVTLSHNGPVVLGANITFKAELFDVLGDAPSGTFLFLWRDNALPQHQSSSTGHDTVRYWNVSYPSPVYAPGPYEVQVIVERVALIVWHICSQRIMFNVTELLNGKMNMSQPGNADISSVVSSSQEVEHTVELSAPDRDYVLSNNRHTLTYWFVDCIYYGHSTDFKFHYNYSQSGVEHDVEALVVSSPDIPMPTTTANPITTVSSPTTAGSATTDATTIPVNTTSHLPVSPPVTPVPLSVTNSTTTPINGSVVAPYVCLNSSIIPPDPNKTYGYFHKHITVKAPVQSVSFTGNNWLQHGDVLNLTVSCSGSSNFSYCRYIYSGVYNATGEETCMTSRILDTCKFTVTHYFSESGTYTIVLIISNDVSKIIKPVAINVYEVTKQPQLSVIIVPVSCSLVAVIIIVFGIAYYIQSQNRYTIEVADFDFGQASDMEYRTFTERLQQGISNAFTRSTEYSTPSQQTMGSSSNKYSNMN
ncbi:uncharacterized protein LOC126335396 isoform X2 [Schistocerca gregaria]|uniref:uncharacterized protein LOC126335396 isoform X2 n=1 Tax=Schistocerca gregaria TaxID=7010 RepID=UPI00211DFC6C|nr:uncharacterized protein LOC126335396 isoform X2 [Schistocerca gregaria]